MITAMEQPLGREVGNANEIAESVAVLHGEGPDDVTELTLALADEMLRLGRVEGGRERLLQAIDDGSAFEKLVEVTMAHGGDPAVLMDTSLLAVAPQEATVVAPSTGWVTRCDAMTIGRAATRLGAGRETKEDVIDPGVGITLHAKIGARVEAGSPLATVRFGDDARWEAQRQALASAWEIGDQAPPSPGLILDRVADDDS
jgi:thymidine phosphorylase